MPTFYSYDPVTGEYMDEGECDASPLEPGVWLIPGSATTEVPPSHLSGMAVVYDPATSHWSLTEDHRGEIVVLGDSFVRIAALGTLAQLGLQPIVVSDAQFTRDGWIDVTINGTVHRIANDRTTLARQVVAAWEAAGETIRAPDPAL